jgi:DNA-binding transcriptional LysR family regulator
MEQAVERARMSGRGEVGRLDIGFFGTSAFDVLPRVLAAYRQTHPRVQLVLHPGQTPAQTLALRQGRVALVFERQVPQAPDIECEVVTRERVFVAMPEAHRLARRKVIGIEDLRNEPMILPEGLPPHMSAMAVRLFRARGFELKEGPRCIDMTSGAVLAASGAGLILIPESMSVLGMPGVVYRPLRTAETFDVYCFYLRDPPPLVTGLLEVVRRLRDAGGGRAG